MYLMEPKYYDLKATIILKTVDAMNFLCNIEFFSFFFPWTYISILYLYRILTFNIFYA